MRHGKFQSPRRKTSPFFWALLILAVLGVSFGGTRAYLSASADSVSNSFSVDVHPTITVGDDYTVTVSDTDYAVYLRAAVVVNWKNIGNGNVLAASPSEFTITPGSNWFLHTDGFYYYEQAVTAGAVDDPVIADFSSSTPKDGYRLTADIAVQAIQAVGTTDGDNPIDAVQDAWGISSSQIAGGSAATP